MPTYLYSHPGRLTSLVRACERFHEVHAVDRASEYVLIEGPPDPVLVRQALAVDA